MGMLLISSSNVTYTILHLITPEAWHITSFIQYRTVQLDHLRSSGQQTTIINRRTARTIPQTLSSELRSITRASSVVLRCNRMPVRQWCPFESYVAESFNRF